MNPDEYHMEWIRPDEGQGAGGKVKNSYGTVLEIFEYISEREYFRLKLAGKLDSRLQEIHAEAVIKKLLEGMEGFSEYISR